MAFTDNGRRTAYDNIASGSATGRELNHLGETVSVINQQGGGTMTSTSTGEAFHTNIEAGTSVSDNGTPENIAQADAVPAGERLGS